MARTGFIISVMSLLLSMPNALAQQGDMVLDICPNNFINFPMDISGLQCACSADQAKADASIWGANPYDSTSDICRAAVHAGAITSAGGQVRITPAVKVPVFPSITRNEIKSASTSPGDGFKVILDGVGSAQTKTAAQTLTTAIDICPNNLINYPADTAPFACVCSEERAKADESIWGANPYEATSDVCRAAVHAGAIAMSGGEVGVTIAHGVRVFPSVTRNDVKSASSSPGDGFAISARNNSSAQVAMVEATASVIKLDVCPNNVINFPADSPPMTCGCSGEQASADESIWGTNPYEATSNVCRAAVHAGAISTTGGEVTLSLASDVPVFPSVTRNGVKSASSNAGSGFKVDVPQKVAAPAVDAAGKPVQAPIAETLKATGRVQLYVNFATDKSDPLPTSAPVLAELLTALRDEPSLKLELIGHTDSQGGAEYNLDLSQRRAASIYLFLVQSGIMPDRLHASGHGLMEPIADNGTDEGRALNRRVEAKQVH
jgi:outer membrane protein OmpA-like peptidoglycan-associated protein